MEDLALTAPAAPVDSRIRHPALVLGLTLVTCGIYGLVWMWQVGTELKGYLGKDDMSPALDVLLTVVTFGLWGVYLAYRYPQLVAEAQGKAGVTANDVAIVSLLLAVTGFWFVSLALVQHEVNRVWRAVAVEPRVF